MNTTVRTDAMGIEHSRASENCRIVCVVPSITELLFDLGLDNQVVGRTGFCFHPKERVRAVPKVGGTKDFDLQKIGDLAPTHLIVNVDENPRELVDAARQIVPNIIVTHPMGPLDNISLYRMLGAVFWREQEADAMAGQFDTAYKEAVARTRDLQGERVLYVIWKKPWMTISPDTYIARTLLAVGWEQVVLNSDSRYPEIEINDVLNDVDRVLLSTEPYAFRPRDVAEVEAMGTDGKPAVSLIDAEMTSWYGSRAIAGMKYLAQLRAQL